VWAGPDGTELVLAEPCQRCASQADGLLARYGGRGRHAVRLVQAGPPCTPLTAPRHRVSGFATRGLVYLLIAIAAFLLVTLISSQLATGSLPGRPLPVP
jgi:hypothetical protein